MVDCLFRVASAASRSNLPPASSYLCRKNRHLELFDLSPGQRRERTGGPVREELEDRARRLLEARLVPPSAAGREGGGERRRVWMEERARVGVALVQVAEAVVYAGRVALAVADAERAIGRGGEAYTEAVSRGQKLTELTAPEAQSLGPTPSGHTLPGRMRARQGSLREPVRKHVRGRIILGVVLVPERVAGIRPHVPRQEAVRGLGTIGWRCGRRGLAFALLFAHFHLFAFRRAKSPVVKTFRPRLHEFPQSYSGGYLFASNFIRYTYDWLLSISEEVQLVSKCGYSWPIIVYFLSRIGEYGHIILIVLFSTAPVGNCKTIAALTGVCSTVGVASTSYLFFLRVRAVYSQSKNITALFGALWFATTVLSIATNALEALGAERIPFTAYCTETSVKFDSLPSISTFVHDTIVFLAISYRLAADSMAADDWRSRLLSITTGKGLLSFSRSLMRHGQLYYLAVVMSFFANLAVITSPSIHYPVEHYMLAGTYLSFTNIMACRAFRGIALRQLEDDTPHAGLTSTKINAAFQLEPLPSAH
ncbi:hypothetical protein FIBSPDRAFT_1041121 [Athelia psychrophila]|uniref:Uncharacterized protein n=1 Tax=Athelia psychrophila TaxID=1759441 RepID=A0A166PGI5_9AGAM|nr:hypothetical protein FIBSPDRAFT_1041121 [Fibularhizoctonia sp. CBS 109695]